MNHAYTEFIRFYFPFLVVICFRWCKSRNLKLECTDKSPGIQQLSSGAWRLWSSNKLLGDAAGWKTTVKWHGCGQGLGKPFQLLSFVGSISRNPGLWYGAPCPTESYLGDGSHHFLKYLQREWVHLSASILFLSWACSSQVVFNGESTFGPLAGGG